MEKKVLEDWVPDDKRGGHREYSAHHSEKQDRGKEKTQRC